jgi:hypothetical protein
MLIITAHRTSGINIKRRDKPAITSARGDPRGELRPQINTPSRTPRPAGAQGVRKPTTHDKAARAITYPTEGKESATLFTMQKRLIPARSQIPNDRLKRKKPRKNDMFTAGVGRRSIRATRDKNTFIVGAWINIIEAMSREKISKVTVSSLIPKNGISK